jgi:hypothetical protein
MCIYVNHVKLFTKVNPGAKVLLIRGLYCPEIGTKLPVRNALHIPIMLLVIKTTTKI